MVAEKLVLAPGKCLTHCMLGNFHAFLSSAEFFQNIFFEENTSFRNTIRMSNSLDRVIVVTFTQTRLFNILQYLMAVKTIIFRGKL